MVYPLMPEKASLGESSFTLTREGPISSLTLPRGLISYRYYPEVGKDSICTFRSLEGDTNIKVMTGRLFDTQMCVG